MLLPKKKRGGKRAARAADPHARRKSSSSKAGSKRKAASGKSQQSGKRRKKSKSESTKADASCNTPVVSPHKNMLIAAAFLKNLSHTSSPRAPSSPAAVSAAITAAAKNMSARGKAAISRLSVQSGAKMLRDAEFLISLGAPSTHGQHSMMASSPSGNRQLVRASSFTSDKTDSSSPRRVPIR